MLITNIRKKSIEQHVKKINTHEWVLIEDSLRDSTWAKIKNGKMHILHWYHDEDGFFSREVFIGNTYEEAVNNKVLSHWETFEPYYDED